MKLDFNTDKFEKYGVKLKRVFGIIKSAVNDHDDRIDKLEADIKNHGLTHGVIKGQVSDNLQSIINLKDELPAHITFKENGYEIPVDPKWFDRWFKSDHIKDGIKDAVNEAFKKAADDIKNPPDDNELKPCPFCGGNHFLWEADIVRLECDKCGAFMEGSNQTDITIRWNTRNKGA